MKLIYGQAGLVQREATQRAVRRFVATALVVFVAAAVVALYARLQSGAFDDLVTQPDAALEDALAVALEGRMWPEEDLRARVADVEGWDTLVVFAPRAQHSRLASLVGAEGLVARDRINRLAGHAARTAPIRVVAIEGGERIVADLDVEWGTGLRSTTRLKREGFLVVPRETDAAWTPEEL